MFIKFAHAQDALNEATTEAAAAMPDPGDAFMANMVLILILVVMFYLLLIRPQQKRFKEHADMLKGLEKGTKVVTQGGLIGKIEKITDDNEVVLDLGNSQKVTMVRSAISSVYESKPGNDNKKEEASASDKKKSSKK